IFEPHEIGPEGHVVSIASDLYDLDHRADLTRVFESNMQFMEHELRKNIEELSEEDNLFRKLLPIYKERAKEMIDKFAAMHPERLGEINYKPISLLGKAVGLENILDPTKTVSALAKKTFGRRIPEDTIKRIEDALGSRIATIYKFEQGIGSLGVYGVTAEGRDIQIVIKENNPHLIDKEAAFLLQMAKFKDSSLPSVPEATLLPGRETSYLLMTFEDTFKEMEFSLADLNQYMFLLGNYARRNHEIFDHDWRIENKQFIDKFTYKTAHEICISALGRDYRQYQAFSGSGEMDRLFGELISLSPMYERAREYMARRQGIAKAEAIILQRDALPRNMMKSRKDSRLGLLDWERASDNIDKAHELTKPLWSSEIRRAAGSYGLSLQGLKAYMLDEIRIYNVAKGDKLSDVDPTTFFAASVIDNFRLAFSQLLEMPKTGYMDISFVTDYISNTKIAYDLFRNPNLKSNAQTSSYRHSAQNASNPLLMPAYHPIPA
ncbi:MAG: hypothetical protein HGA85_08335, partial [Nanoarchaeota archaeon]|nr:hypothetical protein [Nanoarchaeota archaeon]